MRGCLLLVLTLFPLATFGQSATQDKTLRINQLQWIGTHNSYHAGFAPSEAALLQKLNPTAFEGLDYSHLPLDQQFDGGIRQIEIDVYSDEHGGRFSHPAITDMVASANLPSDPVLDPSHSMDLPGFKVMHVAGLDQRSTCQTFVTCLSTVKKWSQAHPTHLPIFILVETKYDKPDAKAQPYAIPTEPFTSATFDKLDAEILSIFKRDDIITPDRVRGSHQTLPEAIADHGWPTLQEARGKVIFLLDQANMTPVYTSGHPGLRGRIIFTNSKKDAPDAAFIEENDGTSSEINEFVKLGYLVRTRTDEPTKNARNNDGKRRDAAMATGAQFLSTDYPSFEPARWGGHYHVEFPGGLLTRCNPVIAPASCINNQLQP